MVSTPIIASFDSIDSITVLLLSSLGPGSSIVTSLLLFELVVGKKFGRVTFFSNNSEGLVWLHVFATSDVQRAKLSGRIFFLPSMDAGKEKFRETGIFTMLQWFILLLGSKSATLPLRTLAPVD